MSNGRCINLAPRDCGFCSGIRAGKATTCGGGVPLGYRYISEPHGGRYAVDEDEASMVRRIFEMCLTGMSTWVIARRLTEERVPTKRDRQPWATRAIGGKGLKRNGVGVWHHSSVLNILTNEAYVGRQSWNKRRRLTKTTVAARPAEEWVSIAVPPIVSDAVFAAAQAQLARNKADAKRNQKHAYLLTGCRLRCGRCGRTMVGFCNKGVRRYRCSSDANMADPGQRCRGSVKADLVEGEVWTAVARVLAQPALIAAEVARQEETADAQRADLAREMALIMAGLATCDRDAQKWERAYLADAIDLADFKAKMAEIRAKRASLLEAQCACQAQLEAIGVAGQQVEALTAYCVRVRQALHTFDAAEKRLAFAALNVQASWSPGGPLVIQGSIPLEGGDIVANTSRYDRSGGCPSRHTRCTSLHRAARRRF